MKYFHTDLTLARNFEEVRAYQRLFEMARLKVIHEGLNVHNDKDWKEFIAKLAMYCYDMGIPEENAIYEACSVFWDRREEVRLSVHNYYACAKQTFASCRYMNKEQKKKFWLEEFLRRNYKLRYNEMTHETEYADLTIMQVKFRPLTNRIRYEMVERANMEGIGIWDRDMKMRLESNSVESYEPMYDFLCNLPEWDKHPRIRKLANTIDTDTPKWADRFYRWFISMVYHWLRHDPRFPNQIIPVLVGAQGCGKSQWIRGLLPEEMQSYYHDGFDPSSKQAEKMMNRYGLINIDEFDAIPARHEPTLKHLLQLGAVHIDEQPTNRYCSFIATSNHYDLHRDTSGSRRYIFVDIKGRIRLNHRLNMLQVYAEAKWAVEHNERTYLSKAEENAMQRDNEMFREQDIVEQMFLNYYEPITVRQDTADDVWLTAYQMIEEMEKLSKKDLGLKRIFKLGRVLKNYCAPKGYKRSKGSTLYHVKRINRS